jgi:general secretion pathway protein G
MLAIKRPARANTRFEHDQRCSSDASCRADDERGFTLVELLTTIGVLAALAALMLPQFAGYRLQAQIAKAISDLRTLDTSVQLYKITNGAFPSSLSELANGSIQDAWGQSYQYLKIEGNTKAKGSARKDKFLVPINSDFDLYSMGPDTKTAAPLTAKASQDDIIRANDGRYIGRASDY